ncbi:MAG: hypothetical protein LBE62_04825 [Azonexus sp.]|jgi:hypothetical protein|nr:hypothetical protein [Azonexus sp.]
MNDAFSPPRFWRLCRQQWQEQRRAWGMFALVLAVLLAVVAGLMLAGGSGSGVRTNEQAYIYIMGLLLSGYLFAHQAFGMWRSREATLVYLMRPGSPFEKWLLSALLLLVLYPLLYSAVFAAVYAVASEVGYRMALAHWAELSAAGNKECAPAPESFAVFFPLRPGSDLPGQMAWGLLYAGLMAYAATGLVFFRRHAALRTLVLALGLVLVTALMLVWLSTERFEYLNWWLEEEIQPAQPPWAAYLFSALLWLGVPILLWAVSYRALRERDLS